MKLLFFLFAITAFIGCQEQKPECIDDIISQEQEIQRLKDVVLAQQGIITQYRAGDSLLVIIPNKTVATVYMQLAEGLNVVKMQKDTTENLSFEGTLNLERRAARLKGQMEMLKEMIDTY